ncbi:MAG: divalent metal cation transporter [Giesbergeria sp.]
MHFLPDKIRHPSRQLGSGLITGAADDDPSGIATYSQAGAAFGVGMAWTLVITTPRTIAIQMVSARRGWITGRGLAATMCRVLRRWLSLSLVVMLLAVLAMLASMGD